MKLSDEEFYDFVMGSKEFQATALEKLKNVEAAMPAHLSSKDPHPEAERANNSAMLSKIAVGTSVVGLALHGLYDWMKRHGP